MILTYGSFRSQRWTVPHKMSASEDMIKRVTETVAEIEASPHPKDNLMPYAWCVIEEVEFENWGIGGNQVTAEMLQAVIAGKA